MTFPRAMLPVEAIMRVGVLLATLGRATTTSHGQIDVCENEVFRALCPEHHVIVMETASFGRMEIGRCIDRNYGYVGCNQNVREQADTKCSGRQSCEVRVPNPIFQAPKCPRDLKPYLSATYKCLKVESSDHQDCNIRDSLVLGGRHGYIASSVTGRTRQGSPECPWIVQAKPGQIIKFTLHDFGVATTNNPDVTVCQAYAIIRERRQSRSETVCNGKSRLREVFTSVGHVVEVRIMKSPQSEGNRHFLLEYQVFGCPDIISTPSRWSQRDGDVTLLGCAGQEASWRLKCDPDRLQWKGPLGNCTEVSVGATTGDGHWGIVSLPFGISIVLVVIIALAIGIVFLIVGLACLRWQKRRSAGQAQHQKEGPYYAGFPDIHAHGHQGPDTRTQYKRELPWTPGDRDQESAYASENEYSYIAEMGPPPPPSGGHLDFPEAPKYFVLDHTDNEGKEVGGPPHQHPTLDNRYVVGIESRMGAPAQRKKMAAHGDLETAHGDVMTRKNRSIHEFGGPPPPMEKVRGENHVSI